MSQKLTLPCCVCSFMYVYAHSYVCVLALMDVYMHSCVCAHVCAHVCVCFFICVEDLQSKSLDAYFRGKTIKSMMCSLGM